MKMFISNYVEYRVFDLENSISCLECL